eukprot:CAMPEP_0183324674 /NCGR_PEP_ID=MMETSP0160_2-20130417/77608_1 /TAXON_ID=2839 ORGANISM="Odontella Sinensis, Strain Grunow 1884" /NCGR_SAMPLE_ID=MMETSP0160_2 /ASSEMBLY_ACC=CAM_ASM_000250 /LENGTH=238 /DNA_ID=CAMNT_0025492297 /DNA_START=81 /DNA_END=797 /DNA_ORIENTATION=+
MAKLNVANVIADIHFRTRDLETSEKESLDVVHICSGGDCEGTAQEVSLVSAEALNNLGKVYAKMGKMKESFKSFEKALFMRKSLLGHDNKKVAESLLDAANSYFESGVRYEVALRAYREALSIFSKQSNIKNPEYCIIAKALTNIGHIEMKLGKYAAAVNHYKRALLAWEKYQGEEMDLKIASVKNFLGVAFKQMDLIGESMECFSAALAKYREKGLGSDHPDVVATIQNMVGIKHDQ